MTKQIIAQGAEALLIKSGNKVIKDRIKKSYRLPLLDEKLRRSRTSRELKLLKKAFLLIPVPKISSSSDYQIQLQFIKGKKLSDNLDKLKNAIAICKIIGKSIAKLHDADIIHGDLTTSNMIYVSSSKSRTRKRGINHNNDKAKLSTNSLGFKVYFIDFGLGFHSARIEDKATDLHVLKEALEARHFKFSSSFYKSILQGYKTSKNYQSVLNQLKKVELRGRYKAQY